MAGIKILRALLVLVYVVLVAVNVWAGVAGTNTEISGRYDTPITPSGWAFSIWGVIFLLQGIWVIWSVVEKGYGNPSENTPKRTTLLAAGGPIMIVWLLECAWQLSFSSEEFISSTTFIIASYVFALWAILRLHKARETVHAAGETFNVLDLVAFWSTAINAAWLSAATGLQLLITPISRGATEEDLTVFVYMIPIAITFLAVWLAVWDSNMCYPATIIWAVSAIKDARPDDEGIQVAGSISVGVCSFFIVVAFIQSLLAFKARRDRAAQGQTEILSGPGSGLTEPLM